MFQFTKKKFACADFEFMKTLFLLLLCTSIFAESIYEKKVSDVNKKAMNNEKIKCRWVCDKKVYKEQKILDAISFYKNSKDYKFTRKSF